MLAVARADLRFVCSCMTTETKFIKPLMNSSCAVLCFQRLADSTRRFTTKDRWYLHTMHLNIQRPLFAFSTCDFVGKIASLDRFQVILFVNPNNAMVRNKSMCVLRKIFCVPHSTENFKADFYYPEIVKSTSHQSSQLKRETKANCCARQDEDKYLHLL